MTITRTVVFAKAYAWVVSGVDEEGKPTLERVGGVEFHSTKPNKRDAFRALKNAGLNVSMEFSSFEVEREVVYAMDLDAFIEHGVEVERTRNGRVTEVSED